MTLLKTVLAGGLAAAVITGCSPAPESTAEETASAQTQAAAKSPAPTETGDSTRPPPIEPETVEVLKEITPGPNVYITARDGGGGAIYIFDQEGTYKGDLPTGKYMQFKPSKDGKTGYLTTIYYERISHGPAKAYFQAYDLITLALKSEVEIPSHIAPSGTDTHMLSTSTDEKFAYVQNATPATSITVVNIAENKVASEVPIPGCWGAYPAQQGYKFTSLCGDGTVITVTLSETGELASKAISAKLFDPEGDPLFTHAERSGEDLVFVSYGGSVYRISDKGEKAAVVDKFSFVDGAEGGWAPGGHELIAYNRAHNMLFVLMHSESYDGSHKDDAEEVWAIDLGQKRALYKSAAKGVSNIAATPGAAPKLFAMGEDDMLVIYETDPEAKFAAKPVKETDVGTGGFIITE